MHETVTIAVGVALAACLGACGRDDRQEKAGAAATDAKKDTPSAAVVGGEPPTGASKGPLQTGEQPAPGAPVTEGTTTGARTTPDPK